jgi:hypothetical protein
LLDLLGIQPRTDEDIADKADRCLHPEQNREHLAHEQDQSGHRLGTCRTLLFDALQA